MKKHLKEFISWKKRIGKSVDPEAFLFASERSGKITLSTIQKRFKKRAKLAGLNPRYSIHSARHTYGTMLCRLTKDLRLVRKQLGHSISHITEVYAAVLDE